MLSDLRRSRRGVATIIAEVMMVLIVILLSAIVYVWVVPAFTSQASKDNAGAAYCEELETALVVTLTNARVSGFTGLYNVQTVNISGSAFATAGNTGITTDMCCAAMYAGGRGYFSMTNSNVTGQVENEVGHNTIVNNNRISGRL